MKKFFHMKLCKSEYLDFLLSICIVCNKNNLTSDMNYRDLQNRWRGYDFQCQWFCLYNCSYCKTMLECKCVRKNHLRCNLIYFRKFYLNKNNHSRRFDNRHLQMFRLRPIRGRPMLRLSCQDIHKCRILEQFCVELKFGLNCQLDNHLTKSRERPRFYERLLRNCIYKGRSELLLFGSLM